MGKKRMMLLPDETIQSLNDEQLGDILRRVVGECRRRGDAAMTAMRDALTAAMAASGLDADERIRIAEEAALREAERLREEEARRVAAEAAERVRREREAVEFRRKEEEARREAERLRSFAQRARELMGHDVAEFMLHVWSRGGGDGEQRVYIGGGYEANWVEYYHTGSARILPGTIKFPVAVDRPLAEHLGCTREDAQQRIKAFCGELCRAWRSLRLWVTEANSPRDSACRVQRWVLRSEKSGKFIRQLRKGDAPSIAASAQEALKYRKHEEAMSALEAGRADGGKSLDTYFAVECPVWLAFPPGEVN